MDRLAGNGQHTISAAMWDAKVKAVYRIEIRDAKGTVSEATVEVQHQRLQIRPPIGKQKRYPALTLAVIHARERTISKHREKIDWKLITISL